MPREHESSPSGRVLSRSVANNTSPGAASRPAVTPVLSMEHEFLSDNRGNVTPFSPVQLMNNGVDEEEAEIPAQEEVQRGPNYERNKRKREKKKEQKRRRSTNEVQAEEAVVVNERPKKRQRPRSNKLPAVNVEETEEPQLVGEPELVVEEERAGVGEVVEEPKKEKPDPTAARRERSRLKREQKAAKKEEKKETKKQAKKENIIINATDLGHIMLHIRDDISKSNHGIYTNKKPAAIEALLTEAVKKINEEIGILASERGKRAKGKGGGQEIAYVIDMGRPIGTEGGGNAERGTKCNYLQIVIIRMPTATHIKNGFPTSSTKNLKH